jgi:uncharacterized membrane protein YozB (DUF420 family)
VNLSFLPAVDATLNGVAGVLLIMGLVFIKQRRIKAHRNCMIAAFAASCLFLVCYLTHYYWRYITFGDAHTRFYGTPSVRLFYFVMLASHILLAMTVPFFAIVQIYLGLRRRDALHRRIGKVAWPVWMYVSVTGVLIYFMLYHFNAPAPGI